MKKDQIERTTRIFTLILIVELVCLFAYLIVCLV